LDADLVVSAVGIQPETGLAKEAGLTLTDRGLIAVDSMLRTSDPDIYAGGDCAAVRNRITGKDFWIPLGSQANRQGRVIGGNLAGREEHFPGAVGAWGIKLFSQNAAGAGLTLESALAEGLDAVSVHMEQTDRAHFYPDHTMMALELVTERKTRRLLGIQGISAAGDALVGRINAVTPLLASGGTVDDLSSLELVYAPPFASALDIVNVLGNVADNVLDGRCRVLDPLACEALWEHGPETLCFLDTRARGQAEQHPAAGSPRWRSIPQDELANRLDELPRDAEIIVLCNTGLRAYEAQLTLDSLGYTDNRMAAGGLTTLKRMGVTMGKPG
jgi:rhodanese-related sulfurtransferase